MTAKNIVKILLPLLMLSSILITGCSSPKNKVSNQDIAAIGDKIASFTIPQGYSRDFAVDMLGYQLISLEGPVPSCHIYLIQAPKEANLDLDNLQDQARLLEGNHKPERLRDYRVVETRTSLLKGQEVPVIVGEGINSENQTYRGVLILFEGRSGPAMVNISSPVGQWDWDMVDEFLASIQ
jgi:hypothetical protein